VRRILIYSMMQLPGLVLAGGLLYYLHSHALLESGLAWFLFSLWVLKEILLYFPARASLPGGPKRDPAGLEGLVGRIEKRLPRDKGFLIRVKHELWRAEGSGDLEAGTEVRVVGREGLTLRIEKTEES